MALNIPSDLDEMDPRNAIDGSNDTTTTDTTTGTNPSNPDIPSSLSASTNVRQMAEQGTEDDPGVRNTTLTGMGTGGSVSGGTEAVAEERTVAAADDPVAVGQVNVGAEQTAGINALQDRMLEIAGGAGGGSADNTSSGGSFGSGEAGEMDGISGVVLLAVAGFVLYVLPKLLAQLGR